MQFKFFLVSLQARPILTQALEDGDYSQLVDPRLENNYNANEMGRMVACAAISIRHSSKRRPKMSQVCILICFSQLNFIKKENTKWEYLKILANEQSTGHGTCSLRDQIAGPLRMENNDKNKLKSIGSWRTFHHVWLWWSWLEPWPWL